ncbi:MAG: 50S ribosomal protein L21 [Synechococcus sp. SB0668_bin_15]|nr:50S ribosomal protein L21 [Synechococcus sp. SB0668_bin_15]MXZ82238.1 50S ribosomal protein L21 [Synechococcus sp. SB0666_bin_14]MYC49577.1 50S ribosomal protein L21 [Synechococcus sp. SB0662_bin_14]MYG46062.1 50S ribosomal protein L21 [Synechococcus sp. SB0675_bin_6]MYJ60074.1 50S ribosomal protein L21 [Synechococcus sp. SB0672_bin_6]MYK91363.1 50S ribosomal protein L21 [Synechococcus sp. SB0669_bin_8]
MSSSSSSTSPSGKATATDSSPAPDPVGAYAIVEACGKQFWLQPGRYYDLDRLDAAVDDTLQLDQVLMVRSGAGVTVGTPYVEGGRINLTVLAHRRGPKLIVYKMRPKKKTRSKRGHRQALTRVRVDSITVAGQPLA